MHSSILSSMVYRILHDGLYFNKYYKYYDLWKLNINLWFFVRYFSSNQYHNNCSIECWCIHEKVGRKIMLYSIWNQNQYHHRGTYIKEWLARFKSVCTNKHYPLTFSLLLFWATKADFQLYVINDGQVRLKAEPCNEGWVSEVHCKRILWFGFTHLIFGNRLYSFILILELMYSRFTSW